MFKTFPPGLVFVSALLLAACSGEASDTGATDAPALASDPTLRQAQVYLECGGGTWPFETIDQSEDGEPFISYPVPEGLTVFGFPVTEAGAGMGLFARVQAEPRAVAEAARARYPNAEFVEFDDRNFQLHNNGGQITEGAPVQTMGINGYDNDQTTVVACGG